MKLLNFKSNAEETGTNRLQKLQVLAMAGIVSMGIASSAFAEEIYKLHALSAAGAPGTEAYENAQNFIKRVGTTVPNDTDLLYVTSGHGLPYVPERPLGVWFNTESKSLYLQNTMPCALPGGIGLPLSNGHCAPISLKIDRDHDAQAAGSVWRITDEQDWKKPNVHSSATWRIPGTNDFDNTHNNLVLAYTLLPSAESHLPELHVEPNNATLGDGLKYRGNRTVQSSNGNKVGHMTFPSNKVYGAGEIVVDFTTGKIKEINNDTGTYSWSAVTTAQSAKEGYFMGIKSTLHEICVKFPNAFDANTRVRIFGYAAHHEEVTKRQMTALLDTTMTDLMQPSGNCHDLYVNIGKVLGGH